MIPFEDKLLGICLGVVFCAIFAFVLIMIAKKRYCKKLRTDKNLN